MGRLKRSVAILAAVLVLTGLWAPAAQAHVLESDGNVSAVLHMPPNDAPAAGKPTSVELAFASDGLNFDISDYLIQVSLKRNSTAIGTTTLQPDDGSKSDGSAVITMPEAGAYRLEVQGTPKAAGQKFTLSYSVRATPSDGKPLNDIARAGVDFWIIAIGSLALLAIVARNNIKRGGRYAPKKARK